MLNAYAPRLIVVYGLKPQNNNASHLGWRTHAAEENLS